MAPWFTDKLPRWRGLQPVRLELVAAGWGGMAWVYCAEMFPQKHRTKAGRSLDVGGLGFVAETGKVPEDTVRDKIFVCMCMYMYRYIYIHTYNINQLHICGDR